jgi:hypothetical protein
MSITDVFDKSHFKDENPYDFTPKEMEHIRKKDFDSSTVEKIKDKHDEKFVEDMESEFAADIVASKEREKEGREQKRQDDVKNMLDLSPGLTSYRANLAEWGMYLMMQLGMGHNWEYHCVPTKKGRIPVYEKSLDVEEGILFVLRSPDKKTYAKGMKVSYMVEVDTVAVQSLVQEVENTYDDKRGRLERDAGSNRNRRGVSSTAVKDDSRGKTSGKDKDTGDAGPRSKGKGKKAL